VIKEEAKIVIFLQDYLRVSLWHTTRQPFSLQAVMEA